MKKNRSETSDILANQLWIWLFVLLTQSTCAEQLLKSQRWVVATHNISESRETDSVEIDRPTESGMDNNGVNNSNLEASTHSLSKDYVNSSSIKKQLLNISKISNKNAIMITGTPVYQNVASVKSNRYYIATTHMKISSKHLKTIMLKFLKGYMPTNRFNGQKSKNMDGNHLLYFPMLELYNLTNGSIKLNKNQLFSETAQVNNQPEENKNHPVDWDRHAPPAAPLTLKRPYLQRMKRQSLASSKQDKASDSRGSMNATLAEATQIPPAQDSILHNNASVASPTSIKNRNETKALSPEAAKIEHVKTKTAVNITLPAGSEDKLLKDRINSKRRSYAEHQSSLDSPVISSSQDSNISSEQGNWTSSDIKNQSDVSLSFRSKGLMGWVESRGVVENPWGGSSADELYRPGSAAKTYPDRNISSADVDVKTTLTSTFLETEVTMTNATAFTNKAIMARDEGIQLDEAAASLAGVEPESETDGSEAPGEPSAEGCNPCYAEPVPDWARAKQQWTVGWELHIYTVGIMFALISVYSLTSIIRLGKKRNLLSRGYFISLNSMILVMGLSRSVYFLVDAYNSQLTFHPVFSYFLYTIGFPCLTSAFSILFLALLKTMRMHVLSPRIQHPRVLVGIIAVHFTLSLTVDVVGGYIYNIQTMLLVCQTASILWGLFLFVGYVYIFRKLYLLAARRQKEMLRLSQSTNCHNNGEIITKIKSPRLGLSVAVVVTLSISIIGFICVGLHLFGIFGVYNSFSSTTPPDPWSWYGLQLAIRLAELGMCSAMTYVATQPFRYRRSMDTKTNYFCDCCCILAPCQRLCEIQTSDDPTESEWNNLCSFSNETHSVGIANNHQNGDVISDTPTTNTQPRYAFVNQASPQKQINCDDARKKRSMLVNESGFIRFRVDSDSAGDAVLSTDDELDPPSLGDGDTRRKSISCKTRGLGELATYNLMLDNNRNNSDVQFSIGSKFFSAPNTQANTPGTPRSFCSTDFDSSVFSFKPPSSINLRASIDNALNYPNFSLKTPDGLITSDVSLPKTPDSLPLCSSASDSYEDYMSHFEKQKTQGWRSPANNTFDIQASWDYFTPQSTPGPLERKRSSLSLDYDDCRRLSSDDTKPFAQLSAGLCRSRSDSLVDLKYDNSSSS